MYLEHLTANNPNFADFRLLDTRNESRARFCMVNSTSTYVLVNFIASQQHDLMKAYMSSRSTVFFNFTLNMIELSLS